MEGKLKGTVAASASEIQSLLKLTRILVGDIKTKSLFASGAIPNFIL